MCGAALRGSRRPPAAPKRLAPSRRHPQPKASDELPLPLYLTNTIFFTLFFSVAYYLLNRWRDKIRTSTPLHLLTFSEISAIVTLIASFIYLLGFFGIDFVQSFILRASHDAYVGGRGASATTTVTPQPALQDNHDLASTTTATRARGPRVFVRSKARRPLPRALEGEVEYPVVHERAESS